MRREGRERGKERKGRRERETARREEREDPNETGYKTEMTIALIRTRKGWKTEQKAHN